MSPFLLYIVRAGLYLGLFYAFYLLVMRRTTFFRLNRILLLSCSYFCLPLPLIRLRTVSATAAGSELTITAIGAEPENAAAAFPLPWPSLLLILYIAGVLMTLALFGISVWKMRTLIRKGKPMERESCRLVLLEEEIPSFSWGRNVVMSRKDLENYPAIFTHEMMHVQCRHSLDLLLLLIFQVLFWWNPLVWIIREELRLLHEYEADEGVIQKGIDATQYQLLLVRKAVGEQRFSLADGFQHAKLKNRIEMMLKPSSSHWMRWYYLALIPVLVASMYACNSPRNCKVPARESTASDQEAIPFAEIGVRPSFNGGGANEFSKWVNEHLQYPETAKAAGIQGRIIVGFSIDTDGSMKDIRILRGVHPDLDAEALRVMNICQVKWTPGMLDDKPVMVTYTFPIIFQLR